MKKAFAKHKVLFIALIAIVCVCLFYLFCYLSWAVFTTGDFNFGNTKYHLNMFGTYTEVDENNNQISDGTWKPYNSNMFKNEGWYELKDNKSGVSHLVRQYNDGKENYLVAVCPVCNSSYIGQGEFYKTNNDYITKYGVCHDCSFSMNKYLSLRQNADIFDESKHAVDGKCDVCGKAIEANDYGKQSLTSGEQCHIELCSEHIGDLRTTVENVIPHWVEEDEITIGEFGAGVCLQLGTLGMEGASFAIYEPDAEIPVYKKGYTGEEEIMTVTSDVIKESSLGVGKINVLKATNRFTVILDVYTEATGAKQIKLVCPGKG